MTNLQKAEKAMERLNVYSFLKGRDVSNLMSKSDYEEKVTSVENIDGYITAYIDTKNYDGTYIVLHMTYNGWNDSIYMNVGKYKSIKELTDRLILNVGRFRNIVAY